MIERTLFSEEHTQFRDSVRRFMEHDVVPHHEAWEDQGYVDRAVWRQAGENGFLCPTMPEAFGGAADDVKAAAIEVDYALDKGFTLYSYYTQITNGMKAKGSFAAADNFPAVVKAGDNPTALGFGIRYNF